MMIRTRLGWMLRGSVLAAVLAVLLLGFGGNHDRASASADIAGHDLFETDSSETYLDLNLPADFFQPGSDPVVGRVYLQGVPFDSFAGFSGLFPTDAIVERLQDAGPIFPDTIDIELVRLELRSVAPLTVTYNGGQDPDDWDMTAQVLEGPDPVQQQGTMTIRHEFPNGGTFDSQFPVTPRLTFTRVDGPGQTEWVPEQPIDFSANNVPWCHEANPLDDPAGHVVVEKLGLTSNFFPGIICPDSDGGGGQRIKVLVTIDAAIARHGVRVAEKPPDVGGIAEVPGVDSTPLETEGSSGLSAGGVAGIAAGVAALAVALTGGAWYVRRRATR